MRSVPLLLLALSLTAPAAQAQNDSATPAPLPSLPGAPAPAGAQRQGPELDVFRDPPAGQAPAPQAPVIQLPPPIVTPPVTTPPPATRTAPPLPPATRETPAADRPARTRANRPAETAPTAPAQAPAVPSTEPARPRDATEAPEPARQSATEPSEGSDGALWLWIIGGLLLLVAGLLLWRRRSRSTLALPAPVEPAEPVAPPTPEPASPPAPRPAARPAPAPSPPPAPAPAADRPHLALALDVSSARLSLMGATVGYGLTLTNVGEVEARDILIRAIIANASAPMDDLLKPFFAGEAGLAVHSVPSLAPGQAVTLTSELRLDPAQIAPINAGQRALLIPLLAFDARYGWGAADGDALGRTGRAFIVGQEQEPPTERLSPFRLDLGPRQFRRPAARVTALALDA